MIAGEAPPNPTIPAASQSTLAIEAIFRQLAQGQPQALALVDPPNRQAFAPGPSRSLTYAQADRAVDGLATRLRDIGLPPDAVIGLQLPNTAESVIAFLGVLRAGMIAAPLPLLWRRSELVKALTWIGAKGLITCSNIGEVDHCSLAMETAAEVFSVRSVCAFGRNLPDGVVPLDDVFAAEPLHAPSSPNHAPNPHLARNLAVVTWDVTADGLTPVARNDVELLAGGLAVTLESELPRAPTILSAIMPASFAGLSLTLLPWLLSGGTLVLHHPFDPDGLMEQRRAHQCSAAILPGPVALRLAQAGALDGEGLQTVIAAWRAPERLAAGPPWRAVETALIDIAIFGESGLVAARRGATGMPEPIALGPVLAPRRGANALQVAELLRTEAGTLGISGPMVPRRAFPAGAERSGLGYLELRRGGVVDTGCPCPPRPGKNGVAIAGPPAGIHSIGGYRFRAKELDAVVAAIDDGATLAALPDALLGQRLAGHAPDRAAMLAGLQQRGVNPLIIAAFRDRPERVA